MLCDASEASTSYFKARGVLRGFLVALPPREETMSVGRTICVGASVMASQNSFLGLILNRLFSYGRSASFSEKRQIKSITALFSAR